MDEIVEKTLQRWIKGDALAGFGHRSAAIRDCAGDALLAIKVYVKLQNSRGLPVGATRKDFVRALEKAPTSP